MSVVTHLQRRIAAGYRPTTTWAAEVRRVGPGPRSAKIAFVLPTVVTRPRDAQREVVAALREQVAPTGALLVVGMQWQRPEEEAEAVRRLESFEGVVGLAVRGAGKIRTLNAAFALAERLGVVGVGWIDDDVRLESGCLERMVAAFAGRGHTGAVGATKIPRALPYRTSRMLARWKAIATPATNYPHGCCLLVAIDIVVGGIPDRYVSDDGFVCFSLLDPSRDDPLTDLELVGDARCHYHVAGPAGQTRRRIRRLLLNHHIFLADWPPEVSGYYLRHILFSGLWPLAPWDREAGVVRASQKWLIKALYFLWFAAIGAELYARGVAGRPLRAVAPAGYSTYEMDLDAV